MKRWLRLSTYMKLMSALYNVPTHLEGSDVFDFDKGKEWQPMVKASAVAMQAATIVMFDRWSMKDDQRRV